jgi:sporadic carbohydrate cluster 2OG-Fe(II) oxygenase
MYKDYFFNPKELDVIKTFSNNGYVIAEVENLALLNSIRMNVEQILHGISPDFTIKNLLNDFHSVIKPSQLNEVRLKIINSLNSNSQFRRSYFELARTAIEILVGNEVAMQLRINLSIQMPDDESSLLPVHADVWSGDSPYEVVLWVPLVDCFKTKSMYILPQKKEHSFAEKLKINEDSFDSEKIFKMIEGDIQWLDIKYGQFLLFNQNLPHGNRVNRELETRWSMNCRFKGVFTPYGDKKLGEFFEPITLRPASINGVNFRYPQIK